MEKKHNNQIAYIQWLRLFAAAAVVLMHTAGSRWLSIAHTDPRWMPLTWWDSLVRWPVPVFIMITGALFLPRRTPLKTALTRYIPRMVLCFAVWSAVYALWSWRQDPGTDPVRAFLGGHYHMWYLPFLWGVYLTLPFLQQIAADEKLWRQLLIVGGVVGIAIPWLVDLAVLLWPGSGPLVRTVENSLNFSFFFDHISLLLLGHWLARTELTPKARRLLYAAGVLGAAVTGFATVWATFRTEFQSSVFFDYTAPNNLCTAAALFVFAKQHLHTLPKAVDRLARWSFGIYLVHPLIIELLAAGGLDVLAHAPGWWTPVLAAAVFALSAAVTAVLGKLPVVGKYLV